MNQHDIYDILSRFRALDNNETVQTAADQVEKFNGVKARLDEKYMGFEKTVKAVAKNPKVKNPEAVAAAIGRKKYGKKKFQAAAAKGEKLGEGIADLFVDTEKLAQRKAKSDQNFANRVGKHMGQQIGDQYHDQLMKTMPSYADEYRERSKNTSYDNLDKLAKDLQAKHDPMGGPTNIDYEKIKKNPMATKAGEQGVDWRPWGPGPKEYFDTDKFGRPMKEGEMEESGLQAYLGKKKYGKEGMQALQKAGREGASKEKMAMIRAKHDKMDEGEYSEDVLTPKQKKFAKLAPPPDKITYADKIAGAKKSKMSESGPINENLSRIMHAMARDVQRFKATGQLSDELYSALYDYYLSAGEMPYGVAKARTGDPYDWVTSRLEDELDIDEGNKFTGNLMKARASGAKQADLDGDGDMEPVREGWKEMQDYLHKKEAPKPRGGEGKKAGTRYGGSAQKDDDEEDSKDSDKKEKRGRGRPKKYTDDKPRQERVTAKSRKADRTAHGQADFKATKKPKKVKEGENEGNDLVKLAKVIRSCRTPEQLEVAKRMANNFLEKHLSGGDWTQMGKDFGMQNDIQKDLRRKANQISRGELDEKAVSKAQQRFMGMAHAMQKGEKIPGASPELKKVAKTMGKGDVKDFAKTKHAGLPQHVKKKTDETTVAGGMAPVAMPMGKKRSRTEEDGGPGGIDAEKPYRDPKSGKMVTPPKGATQPPADSKYPPGDKRNMPADTSTKKAEAPAGDTAMAETDKNPTDQASKKAKKGGMQFGKGIYDSFNRELEGMIAESMNVSTSLNTDGPEGLSKSITITASEDDAERLAMLLKMAGLGDDHGQYTEACPACGQTDCGCDDMHIDEVTENEPDYPENSGETQDEVYMLQKLAGGLNGPKRQINPNNMADNPMAMKKLGASNSGAVNIEETAKVESHLWTLYRKVN